MNNSFFLVEVEQMLTQDQVHLPSIDPILLDGDLSSGPVMTSHPGSSSGGYAHNVFVNAAKELFNQEQNNLQWKTLR